jgi:hypothetical protein
MLALVQIYVGIFHDYFIDLQNDQLKLSDAVGTLCTCDVIRSLVSEPVHQLVST